jgi:hypothetical protein
MVRLHVTWIENKNELEILYLNYDDLVDEKQKTISVISKFLNLEIRMTRKLEIFIFVLAFDHGRLARTLTCGPINDLDFS